MGFVAVALGDASFAAPGSDRWKTIGYTGPTSFADVFAAYQRFFGDTRTRTAEADILAFRDRGGKLLMWHGTGDSLICPPASINYYESVSARAGGYAEAQKFARFYLAPGKDHCFFASVSGTATSAPGVTPVRKRPWCPYPKKLHCVGGDVNTGSFSCD